MRPIDADLFKKGLEDEADSHGYDDQDSYDMGVYNTYMNVIDLLDEQPTAEPERKKGKWIFDHLCSTGGGIGQVRRLLRCSECDHQEPWPWLTSRNFCPNCGADMRGERDG